jgi:hypothetical protein
MRRLFFVLAAAVSFLVMMAAPASATTIIVSRTSVPVGGVVVVSGDTITNGSKCAAGDTVTLISVAFGGHTTFAGVAAVTTPVDGTGHFRVSVAIRASVKPGTYVITGRCGGGNLGVEATLVVTGLPNTGASSTRDAELGFGLVLGGAAVVALTTRRRDFRFRG